MYAYFLQLESGPGSGEQYPLTRERTVIGRHPSCDLMIPESAVSRQHAAITLATTTSTSTITLEDLGSRNGTFVNGEKVVGPAVLRVGDELCIGGQQIKLGAVGTPDEAQKQAEATMFFDTGDESLVVSQVDLRAQNARTDTDRNATAKLHAAHELGVAIGSSLDPELVPARLVEGLFTIFPKAERAFVLLIDRESGKPVLRARKLQSEESGPLMLSRSLIDKVVRGRRAILSADATGDSRLNMNESILACHIRSVMCAPISREGSDVLGVLQVDSRELSDGFRPDDLEVLASLAEQAARAIEQAIAHEDRVRREKLRRDLDLARQVQQGMLPKQPPEIPGYDIFDFYSPARQVGGDYYDYVPLPDGRMVAVLADVSGKGVSAALVMATLSSKVALAVATESDVATAVARINASFCSNEWEERFATAMVCVIDPGHQQATLVNAGHLPLALRHPDGRVELVGGDLGCLPLGWDPDAEYRSLQIPIEPGATLVLYTDGISEAMDVESAIYDFHRLTAVLAAADGSAEETGRRIIADVERYTAGQVQTDDMCLICVHRQA